MSWVFLEIRSALAILLGSVVEKDLNVSLLYSIYKIYLSDRVRMFGLVSRKRACPALLQLKHDCILVYTHLTNKADEYVAPKM